VSNDKVLIEPTSNLDDSSAEGSGSRNPFISAAINHATEAMERIRQAIGDDRKLPKD
jgi:hypothetical protein